MATTARARAERRAAQRQRARGQGIRVTLEGQSYEVWEGDLSALDIAMLRREAGYSWLGLLRAATTDMDLDVVAALAWLARRVNGERNLPFEAVASQVNYETDLSAEGIDPEPADAEADVETAAKVIEGEVEPSPEA